MVQKGQVVVTLSGKSAKKLLIAYKKAAKIWRKQYAAHRLSFASFISEMALRGISKGKKP